MFARSLSLLALTAAVAAATATQALAGSCCGCAYTCAPPTPAQIQIWGLSPAYVVNQGPVYSGPGFYTAPTYEGEVSTADYPYVGNGFYPRYYRPYDGGPYADPFRHRLYHSYWPGELPVRPHHFEILHRHGASVTMSGDPHWVSRSHKDFRDPHDR
jgi:hypothetical protein